MRPYLIYLTIMLLSHTLHAKSYRPMTDDSLFNHIDDEEIEWRYMVPQYGNITVSSKIMCREHKSQKLAWLHHENFHKCVTLLTDTSIPSCLYEQLERNNLTVINKNKMFLLGDVEHLPYNGPKCDTYMILTQNFALLQLIFGKGKKNHFNPFSNIFLFVPKTMIIPQKVVREAMKHGYNLFVPRNSFFNRSMNYFNLNYWMLKNLATNQTISTRVQNPQKLANFFGTFDKHPLFNQTIFKKKPFRVGLFHCPPYVVVKDKKNNK